MTAAYIQLLLHRKLTRCSSCHPAHRANKTACRNRRPPQTHCTGARYTLDNCPRVTELGHKCVGMRRSLRAKTPERQLISHSNQRRGRKAVQHRGPATQLVASPSAQSSNTAYAAEPNKQPYSLFILAHTGSLQCPEGKQDVVHRYHEEYHILFTRTELEMNVPQLRSAPSIVPSVEEPTKRKVSVDYQQLARIKPATFEATLAFVHLLAVSAA